MHLAKKGYQQQTKLVKLNVPGLLKSLNTDTVPFVKVFIIQGTINIKF
jgi:hypothetical protein